MNETSYPTPDPFEPRAAPSMPSGCGKPVLVGCGAAAVIAGIGVLLLLAFAPRIFGWALGRFESQLLSALPPTVDAAERARLEAAFDSAIAAVAAGEADPQALLDLQGPLTRVAGKSGEDLTAEDVRELTEALERVAGRAPADGGGEEERPTRPPESKVARAVCLPAVGALAAATG